MSTTNIIKISGKSDDLMYPSSELEDLNIEYNTSDPLVAKLSKVAYRELQEKRDRLKQNKTASAFATVFTCMLCVAMSVVIITKLLEDGDRAKLYDSLSENSSSPKVYENQKRPNSVAPVLLAKSSDPKFPSQIMLNATESVTVFNNSGKEMPANNETITLTSELNLIATTEDTINDIPTVAPLPLSSFANLNTNNTYILSYFLIALLIFKF